eukprot:CAMPEP_0168327586 /NCGR_PEP_ID=MMETSP0213-20121227/5978_1 /TAXON_ID=151035 /ORGANISM="Euplotes harpa, Strain FSP1.4" /LENGTH=56 /DNA_ID=CAMNT_0008330503 /DNA_START=337 /DNA_END=507 /DNA_ORIENTATION=+
MNNQKQDLLSKIPNGARKDAKKDDKKDHKKEKKDEKKPQVVKETRRAKDEVDKKND